MRLARYILLTLAVVTSLAAVLVDEVPERIVVTQLPAAKPCCEPPAVEVEIGEPVVEKRRLILLRLSPDDLVAAARLVVNEDSRPLRPVIDGGTAGELTVDAYGILQVVFDWADRHGRTHHGALHALSRFVVGGKPPTRRRHAVSRSLPAFGDARPLLWRDELDGPWEAYSDNWVAARLAVRTACTRGFRAPFKEKLEAWGGSFDDRIALSRGLVRATCAPGTANTFWTRPKPKAVSARVAAGKGRT